MGWIALYIYIAVAETIFFSWIWWSTYNCDEIPTCVDFSKLTSFQRYRTYIVMYTLMFIAAPFAFPVMLILLFNGYRQATAEHKEMFGRHLEMQLTPLHPSNMPVELAAYIEEHSPDAIAMGYEELGDYWLKEEPYNSKARIYLHSDRNSFVEIGFTLGIYYCEAISFLEDGSLIGTANANPVNDPYKHQKHGYYANLIGEADMSQTIDSHFKFVEEVSQRVKQPVREISQEQWMAYYHYHNRKYGQMRYELCEVAEPPESCVFPAKSASENKGEQRVEATSDLETAVSKH